VAQSNRVVLVNRTREAARELYTAVEKARVTFAEYTSDGGADYTDPYFYVDEDVNGELRQDLDITKEQLTAAEVALNAITAPNAMAPGATINDYLPALSQVK